MAENIMDLSVTRGGRVSIVADAVPADAVEGNVYGRSHAPEDALVIQSNIYDPKVGFFHRVMFNAGTKGVIFKSVLASQVTGE